MVQYITEVILPYVESHWADQTTAALVIMDNFKGQVTPKINALLEENNIQVCLLPANTTDLLQPMDIAVNKPAEDFLKRKFEEWYSQKVVEQLDGVSDVEAAQLSPINFCMAAVKELSAKWLVEMAAYIADNPQFIVSGFVKAGIPCVIDGVNRDANESASSCDEDELSQDSFDDDSMMIKKHLLITWTLLILTCRVQIQKSL